MNDLRLRLDVCFPLHRRAGPCAAGAGRGIGRRGHGGRRSGRSGRSPADDGLDLPRQEADRRSAADGPGPSAGRDRQSPARPGLRPPHGRCPRRRGVGQGQEGIADPPGRAGPQGIRRAQGRSRSPRPIWSGRSSGGWSGTAIWPSTARRSAARPGSRITTAIWTARSWSSATSFFVLPPAPARRRSRPWRSGPNRSARRSLPARSTSPRPRRSTLPVPAASKAAGSARSAATVRWTSRSPARLSNSTPGEISPPVRSPFGVHLIRCDEVVPGKKKVSDLSGPIDEALAKELLEKLSAARTRSRRR